MGNPNHSETAGKAPWKPWRKISFRFFFTFFALNSYLLWDAILYLCYLTFTKDLSGLRNLYKPLTGFCYWLDKHVYHFGYNPKIHVSFPGDGYFGAILYITALLLTVVITVVWSILDKQRGNYNKLAYWFNIYLRYLLAMVIFGYGIDKLIPVQMRHPNLYLMTAPFGDLNRYNLLWSFMGASPGYQMFTGICEIVASLLLFSRRTAVAGYLLMLGVLSNVVALNWFYNVSVKIFSTHLLLCTLFLFAPYAGKLYQLFFNNNPIPFSKTRYVFQTKWKKYVLTAIMIFIPLIILAITTIGVQNRYQRNRRNARKEKMYDVTAFAATDSLPPLTADSSRWKRLLLNEVDEYALVYTMDDDKEIYGCEIDSLKKTFTFFDRGAKKAEIFNYVLLSKGRLQLTGKWYERNIRVSLNPFPVDSMFLNKDKIKLIQE